MNKTSSGDAMGATQQSAWQGWAGPIFVNTVKQYGYILFLGGVVVTLVPLIAGLFGGPPVLKLNRLCWSGHRRGPRQ